jgi:C-terminal processing protease CtpA/Prc
VFRFETSYAMGLKLRTLGEQLGGYFQAPGGHGVLVEEVEEESDAAKAGFQAGDVITNVGTETVEEVRDVRRAIRNAGEGETVAFDILRRGNSQKLNMTVEKREHSRRFHFRSHRGSGAWWFDTFDDELEKLKHELEHLHRSDKD